MDDVITIKVFIFYLDRKKLEKENLKKKKYKKKNSYFVNEKNFSGEI